MARGHMSLYRSYNFVTQDPIVDAVRTMIRDEGLKEKNVAMLSSLSHGCVGNMIGGVTRCPRFSTVAAIATALGYDHIKFGGNGPNFVKTKEINYHREEKKAADELLAHRERERRRDRLNGKRRR